LRLDRHALAAAGQFAKVDIKHMVGKMKLHGFIPVKTSQVISDRQVISGHCSSRRRLTGFPARSCAKSHRSRPLTEKSKFPQGKISLRSESLGPPRAMFGSSQPHSVAA